LVEDAFQLETASRRFLIHGCNFPDESSKRRPWHGRQTTGVGFRGKAVERRIGNMRLAAQFFSDPGESPRSGSEANQSPASLNRRVSTAARRCSPSDVSDREGVKLP
jgi:hypothetical protein